VPLMRPPPKRRFAPFHLRVTGHVQGSNLARVKA
jgi:hypothetical protein